MAPSPANPANPAKSRARAYLTFVLLSGAGWLCDFSTFTVLVSLLHWPPFAANFVSSYAGVTFVWITSLHSVFGRSRSASGRFLLLYWGYQFVSILLYSRVVQWGAASVISQVPLAWLSGHAAVATKILVTPLNLATNFLFMRWLTRFMTPSTS